MAYGFHRRQHGAETDQTSRTYIRTASTCNVCKSTTGTNLKLAYTTVDNLPHVPRTNKALAGVLRNMFSWCRAIMEAIVGPKRAGKSGNAC